MDQDMQETEAMLKALQPERLDEDFLDRLTAAVGGSLEVDNALRPVEAVLRRVSPAEMPEDLVSAFEAQVAEIPFPVDEKVVMFPKGNSEAGSGRRARKPWVAAVAAAVVAGAFTAMMVTPGADRTGPVAESHRPVVKGMVNPGVGALVPAGMGTGLAGARDEGVVWSSDQRPMRVVRVEYQDRIEFDDKKGKRAEIGVPRVEFILVPVEVD